VLGPSVRLPTAPCSPGRRIGDDVSSARQWKTNVNSQNDLEADLLEAINDPSDGAPELQVSPPSSSHVTLSNVRMPCEGIQE
jgi:hypothetical protein